MDQPETSNNPVSSNEPQKPVSDYINKLEPVKKYKNKRKTNLVILIIVLLVAAGGGALLFIKKQSPKADDQKKAQTSQTQTDSNISADTKKYSSNQFRLSFEHPSNWTVTDESGTGKLSVISPKLNLTMPSGGTAKGQITMLIRSNTVNLDEFEADSALAAIESEKIAYTNPSPAQRGQTYISLLRYANSENDDFDAVYITGDYGYLKDQEVLKADIQKLDPIVSISFTLCEETCTQPTGISINSWEDPEFGGVLENMLQSLVIN